MQGSHPDGAGLIAVRYRFISKVLLWFIATKNWGSAREGDPCEMKFTDDHRNVHVRIFSICADITLLSII